MAYQDLREFVKALENAGELKRVRAELDPVLEITEVAQRVGVTSLQVNEVLSYYSMLHRKPMGKYHVQICTNISCLLTGGETLWERACEKLGIGHKEVSADGQISLEEVECIGACSWAPALQVNYDFHHKVTPEKLDEILAACGKSN